MRKFASKVDTKSQPNGSDAIAPGTPVTDLATVTSGEATEPTTPGGTVSFFLCAAQPVATACTSGGSAVGGARPLNGGSGVAESPPTSPAAEGVYCWRAEYSGDTVYNSSVHTNTSTECFTVRRQALDIQTTSTPNNGDVIPGTSASDKATIKGTYGMPSGTVTFFLCAPSQVTAGASCVSGGTQIGDAVALVAGGTTLGISTATGQSIATTSTNAGGTYCWRAEYSGDGMYGAASHTNDTTECFTVEPWYLPTGAFVIGDQSGTSTAGTAVTFWGAQWWKKNTLSKGSAPGNSVASFKGFANSTTFPFSCGGTWASDPGNSSGPPAGPLPLYMAVIITDTVQKPGSLITGTIFLIVPVIRLPGYGPNPGHAGTGTIDRVICSS